MSHIGHKNTKGFAMLFAVLVSSVLLAVGLSIFNLTVKELSLSASGRESQFAFFAADTGAECALYWDIKGSQVFATSSASVIYRTPVPTNPDCVDAQSGSTQTVDIYHDVSATSDGATTQFDLTIPNGSTPYCVTVVVKKEVSNNIVKTTIDSRGYNTCSTSDPNRVERALKITYY